MKRADDFQTEKVLAHGRPLIANFSILVKLTGMYDSMNETMMKSAAKVLKELDALIGDEGELALKMTDESFFIDDTRIKATAADIDNFSALIKDLDAKKIGLITFKAPLQTDDLIFLAYSIKGGSEASEIQSVLESRLTKGISVGGPLMVQREQSIDMRDTRRVARWAYTKAIAAFKDINESIRSGRGMNVKKAKRSFQSIVDSILKDESYVLGLTTIRDTKNYYYNHSVNVAILSIALGMRVGLSKYHLTRLGMAALLHDIGKVEIPLSILNKASEFNPKETALIERHPVDGVKELIKTWGLNEVSIISMLASYEHHLNLDLSGYPPVPETRRPILFSRIIKIADDFDSLVSGKVKTKTPMRPEDALRMMFEEKKGFYDRLLLKAFVEIFSRQQAA